MRAPRWLPPALWAGVILTLTSWPKPPDVSGPEGSDKLLHALLYAVQGFLVMRAVLAAPVPSRTLRTALIACAGVAAFGAVDEWHQRFIPERSADVADWVADASGGVAGVAACVALAAVQRARRERAG